MTSRNKLLNLIVKYCMEKLDSIFGALADDTRRAIVRQLSQGEASVGELAAPFDISLPAITKHLRVLEHAGLIATHKSGRVRYCRLRPAQIREAVGWLSFYEKFWDGALDNLEQYFEEQRGKAHSARRKHSRKVARKFPTSN